MADDPKRLRILVSVPSEIEAAAVVIALADHGIEASATGGYTSGFKAEAPGDVKVIVQHADFDRAKQALAEIQEAHGKIDWSQIDVGEPEEPDTRLT